jgi:hypothetical protein
MENEEDRACNTNEAKRNALRILVGKPEGKEQLGRTKYKWVDNTKMGYREIRWGCMDYIDLAENRDH